MGAYSNVRLNQVAAQGNIRSTTHTAVMFAADVG
jgi:hypothetical protein